MALSGTIQELDGLLKTTYHGSENEQMAVGNIWMTRLLAFGRNIPVAGESPTFTTNYTRSRGVGFRNSTAAIPNLPTPKTGKFKQITPSIPEFYAYEQFSERQIKSAKGAGTFVPTVINKTDQLIRDFRDAMGISLYSPKKGQITYVELTPTITQFSLKVDDKVRLQEGNFVDLIDATDGLAILARGLEVISFDVDTQLVTFGFDEAFKGETSAVAVTTLVGAVLGQAANVAIVAGDWFVYEESNGLSYTGLEQQVAEKDTSIHNIDRNVFKYYNPTIVTADAGAGAIDILDSQYLRLTKNNIKIQSRGSQGYDLDCVITNPDVQSGFEDTLDDNVRYQVMQGDKAPNLTAGYEVLRHDKLDIMDDRYATRRNAYMLSTPSFNLLEMAPTEFIDYDGSLFNRINGKPAYEFGLLNMMELSSYHLRANGTIKNLKGLSEL